MFSLCVFCFFKQKTAYEMRISDWSSDVCSSDLDLAELHQLLREFVAVHRTGGILILQLRGQQREECVEIASQRRRRRTGGRAGKIGRASCRERVCQYV